MQPQAERRPQPASSTAATSLRSATEAAYVPGAYVRNAWYVALWAGDLAAGQFVSRRILGKPLAFFRREDGAPVALMDRCPHRFAALSMGKILPGDRVQCPYHGLEFDQTGACVRNPHGNGVISPAARVTAYPVVEKHTLIWIWMGDRTPDPSLIPDFSILDTAEAIAVTKRDRIVVHANYQLVTDNLLDLSHTSYVHDGILGNAEMVDSEIKVDQQGDVVTVSRRSENSTIPGLFRMLWPAPIERVDKWNSIRWTAPGNLLLRSGVCEPGSDPERGTGYYGIHLLTPETDTTTHYHFTAVRWNLLTADAAENEAIREKLSATRRFAFAEQDGPVIEAQQGLIDIAEEPLSPILLSIDVGPVRYKRVLQRLMAED